MVSFFAFVEKLDFFFSNDLKSLNNIYTIIEPGKNFYFYFKFKTKLVSAAIELCQ